MASKINIVNQALVRLGESAITDYSLPVGNIIETVYDTVRQNLLTSYRWRFAMKKVALTEASGSPVNEWTKHFTLPSDMLLLVTTYPTSNYEVFEDKLLTNASSVSVDYVFDPGEKKYPQYFVNALALEIADAVCMPITNDKTMKEIVKVEAETATRSARFKDASGRPPSAIQDRPFIDVRR